MERPMTRRDALIRVIDCLHAEIAALKANDIVALERATRDKLTGIEAVAAHANDPPTSAAARKLAGEATHHNDPARIHAPRSKSTVHPPPHTLPRTTPTTNTPP